MRQTYPCKVRKIVREKVSSGLDAYLYQRDQNVSPRWTSERTKRTRYDLMILGLFPLVVQCNTIKEWYPDHEWHPTARIRHRKQLRHSPPTYLLSPARYSSSWIFQGSCLIIQERLPLLRSQLRLNPFCLYHRGGFFHSDVQFLVGNLAPS